LIRRGAERCSPALARASSKAASSRPRSLKRPGFSARPPSPPATSCLPHPTCASSTVGSTRACRSTSVARTERSRSSASARRWRRGASSPRRLT
jgi:hypothetical protein